MSGRDRTIIIVDDNLSFTPSDFMLAWNAEQSDSDVPMATLLQRGRSFDGSLMTIVGDVANVLQIVGFIGVPTVALMVRKMLKMRAAGQPGVDDQRAQPGFELDETVIDLDREGKVQRITIRHVAN
jgi:hypothetical protein